MPYNLAWGGEFDSMGKSYGMKQGNNMPPATPDPKMSYNNISSTNLPSTRGAGMFPYRGDNFNHPMASPMYMPFMNESPRPETRAARY